MKRNELMEKITVEMLREMVEECNLWAGTLKQFRVYYFDEDFFHMFYADDPMGAARATHFGSVNWSDEYITFDGYKNLKSYSEYDYNALLMDNADEIVDAAIEAYRDDTAFSSEITAIFDEYLDL